MPGRAPARRPLTVTAAAIVSLVATVALAPAALAEPESNGERPPAHAYRASGLEVEGGTSIAQAATIDPGIHLDGFARGSEDTFSSQGTRKYYRIAVEDGQRVHAAATIAPDPYEDGLPEEPEALEVTAGFLTADGDTCTGSSTEQIGESHVGDGPVSATAVSEVVGPDGCRGSELFLLVIRKGPRAFETELPVEIQVAIQPPGIGGGSPAVEEEIEDAGASPLPPEGSEPIALGRSFAEATPLEPGSYLVELVPGETGLVSVQVGEGQRLRWRTEEVSEPGEDPGAMSLRVHNAARAVVTTDEGPWHLGVGNGVHGGAMTAPVDLGNRGSDLDSVQSAWLPGTHTVMLQRFQRETDAASSGSEPVRLVLTLEVQGEVAADAAEGDVLELGEISGSEASEGWLGLGDWSPARLLMLAGAAGLGVLGLVTFLAGSALLLLRRR